MDVIAESSYIPHLRRLSHPLKIPRILNLVRESSRPDENEVKSEAQFQRLVTSFSKLPMRPHTPQAPSDRGRYPEEVSEERDVQRCQTPSCHGSQGPWLEVSFSSQLKNTQASSCEG
ncbi:hypothetical protein BGW80DRAFT_1444662 [Lactifluus volemus]|nr:hypothetical protein BGW80DRAFT_1444662 [Lactifluus volemus]